MQAKNGDWVEIENIVLHPEERGASLPEDTKKTPLKMWARGFLVTEEAEIDDDVLILTLARRVLEGKLIETNPRHTYDFGETIIELLTVGEELKQELANELNNKLR